MKILFPAMLLLAALLFAACNFGRSSQGAATGQQGPDSGGDTGGSTAGQDRTAPVSEGEGQPPEDAGAVSDAGPAGLCGLGGVCHPGMLPPSPIPPGTHCDPPDEALLFTGPGCKLDDGAMGYCCTPDANPDAGVTPCQQNADCPGCQICDQPAEGQALCVEVHGTCLTDADCPESALCVPVIPEKPECGMICEYKTPDAGWPDPCAPDGYCFPGSPPYCNSGEDLPLDTVCSPWPGIPGHCCNYPTACIGEAETFNGTGEPDQPPCCYPLIRAPSAEVSPDGECLLPQCDCFICVRCGDGECGPGENGCTCARDCPSRLPGGPGAACQSNADCRVRGGCLPEAGGYPTGGYCAADSCQPTLAEPSNCPASAICLPDETWDDAAHCYATCRSDQDCHPPLTCETWRITQMIPMDLLGAAICWEDNRGLGRAMGQPCDNGMDCISADCTVDPRTGQKACSTFCNEGNPCKREQTCVHGDDSCGSPGCGSCFY